MARTIVTQEMIEQMNELYLQIGTYVGVSRAMGGTPSASTVKKYIIENYISKEETMKKRKLFTQERLNELDNISENFWDKFCIENWGDLCVLSEEEVSEITELWDEITI